MWPEGWDSGHCLAVRLTAPRLCQVMSIEEVERILDETQEAVDYQRVGVPRLCGRPPPQPTGTIANLGERLTATPEGHTSPSHVAAQVRGP